MFEATTNDIKVEVQPAFERDQSNPAQSHYFFSYKVRIINLGSKKVQLLSRYWLITDGFGQTEEVAGPGVVGKQPTLNPGEAFEYSSFCPLKTPTGSMQGTYTLVDGQGEQMQIKIPLFILSEPNHYH